MSPRPNDICGVSMWRSVAWDEKAQAQAVDSRPDKDSQHSLGCPVLEVNPQQARAEL